MKHADLISFSRLCDRLCHLYQCAMCQGWKDEETVNGLCAGCR